MLVLSRKPGERIIIGGRIEVTVVKIVGQRVRLGFNAPDEVAIHRGEVYRQIHGWTGEKRERCRDGESPFYPEFA